MGWFTNVTHHSLLLGLGQDRHGNSEDVKVLKLWVCWAQIWVLIGYILIGFLHVFKSLWVSGQIWVRNVYKNLTHFQLGHSASIFWSLSAICHSQLSPPNVWGKHSYWSYEAKCPWTRSKKKAVCPPTSMTNPSPRIIIPTQLPNRSTGPLWPPFWPDCAHIVQCLGAVDEWSFALGWAGRRAWGVVHRGVHLNLILH